MIPGHHDAGGEQGLLLLSVHVEAVLDGADGRIDVDPLAGGVDAEAEAILQSSAAGGISWGDAAAREGPRCVSRLSECLGRG